MEKAQSKRGRKRKAEGELELANDNTAKKKGKKIQNEKCAKSDVKDEMVIDEKSVSKDRIIVQSKLDLFVKNEKIEKKQNNTENNIINFDANLQIIEKTTDHEIIRPELEGRDITIYSWNVNGFRAVMSKGAVSEFIKAENPDILCFNETKIDEKIIQREQYESTFKEYNCYWNCCKTKAGYSGVAIFSKIKPENVIHGINSANHDGEGRVLTLEFPTYFLVSAYIPNSGEGLKRLDYRIKEWDEEFMKFIQNLKKTKDVIFCGDLNVAHKDMDIFAVKGHLKSAGFTLEERNNFTKFLSLGYTDTFRHLYPTLIKFSYFNDRFGKKNLQNNKGWRLDYFVINNEAIDRLVYSDILNHYDASDHSPIKLTWKV